jgi:lipoate-protein ligase A
MPVLDLIVEPSTTPAASRFTDVALLARAVAHGRGTLRVSRLAGTVLALGRYHLAPAGGAAALHRRLSGGRAWAAGEGFVQVSLTLPHRSALVSGDPLALAPEQLLNRAVRGLLGGLDAAGVSALYPGRDAITVARRTIGLMGFEIDGHGATLIEACVDIDRDQATLPHLLEELDPDGVVGAQMIAADDATSLARELGRHPSFDEVAACIRRGYESRLGVEFVEAQATASAPPSDDGFVRERMRRAALDRRGTTPTMLGVLEAHVGMAADGTIAELMLAGDILAPSGTVARLEQAVRGCPPERNRLAAVIADVVRPPHDFILGVGPLDTVADTIVRGVG